MHLNGTKALVLRRDANNVYERVIVRLDDSTEISLREVNCLFPRIDGSAPAAGYSAHRRPGGVCTGLSASQKVESLVHSFRRLDT